MALKGYPTPKNKPINQSSENNVSDVVFIEESPRYSLDEIILSHEVYEQINTIVKSKIHWNKVFNEWGLNEVMKDKKNLFVNLYGESGTGKSMTAHAIANELNQKILAVNYADIESKYVGETSKNLVKLFDYASQNNCIIFFDEADALLSKRVTNMSSANDVSVNQTRSVLLTQLNHYSGMVIFATNFISNYDSAFMRRIQFHVRFDLPNEELRLKLWKKYVPVKMPNHLDFEKISHDYESISGSDISTAVLKAALKTANNEEEVIPHEYFSEAVESIIASKKANKGNSEITITQREVSEDYVMQKLGKSEKQKCCAVNEDERLINKND